MPIDMAKSAKALYPRMHARIQADNGSYEQACLSDKDAAVFLKDMKLPAGAKEWVVTTCYCSVVRRT